MAVRYLPPLPSNDDPSVPSLVPPPAPPSVGLPAWAVAQNSEARAFNSQLEKRQAAREKKAGGGRMGYGLAGGGGGGKEAGGGPLKLDKLDLRFADGEDAEDIHALVAAAYGAERLPLPEVTRNLEGGRSGHRWLLVETGADGLLVGACRLRMEPMDEWEGGAGEGADERRRKAVVDVFAVLAGAQGRGGGGFLLKKAESVARGGGCLMMEIGVGHWQERVQAWAGKRGYEERGGEGGDNLEGLVGDLLTALKTDEGRAKFKELAKDDAGSF
ncbi:hypothetical protein TeGR_g13595 [Tetraparma gracilis]|uniref:N-acetyltransferase domain-containing protein n=1 Tax=Tetraparma gracilis TaxID=2962635 RepID=A0ABQ6N0Y5_9STRA|nr:hypothetical protein TeGR_g13595 [Tetraparma gracilis]